MIKFKVGDLVRILPSAIYIGVRDSEVDTIQTVIKIEDSETIVITDSSDGSWWVNPGQVEPAIKIGQQFVFSFMGAPEGT